MVPPTHAPRRPDPFLMALAYPAPANSGEVPSFGEYLSASKVLALVMGTLELIGFLTAVVVELLGFGFGWFGAFLLVGSVANLLLFFEIGAVQSEIDGRRYRAAREKLLLWTLVGFVFGWVLIGVLLIIAYARIGGLLARSPGTAHPSFPLPGPARVSPPGVPATPVPFTATGPGSVLGASLPSTSGATALGVPACPRCGRPAAWIPPYNRWFCYFDYQYL